MVVYKTSLNMQLGHTKMEALDNEILGPYALLTSLNDLNVHNLYFCLKTHAIGKILNYFL